MPRPEQQRRRQRPTVEAQPRPAVRFSPTSQLFVIDRVARSDAAGLWYSGYDLHAMRDDYRRDVLAAQAAVRSRCSLMEAAYENGDGQVEVFGLEDHIAPELVQKRLEYQLDCWIAVLSEQARQDESDEHDPLRLAALARRHSWWAEQRAHAVGLLQEKYGPRD